MKTLFNLVILSALTGSLLASPKCERLAIYDRGNVLSNMTYDLTSQVWKSDILGTSATLYFNSDGVLMALPDAPGGRITSYLWSVSSTCCSAAMLTIGDASAESYFILSPTCSGIATMDDIGRQSALVQAHGQLTQVQLVFLRDQLQGTWHYSGAKSRKGHPSAFALCLNADGSFQLKMAPDMFHTAQTGIWQLSPDGQYLLLYTQLYLGDRKRYVAEAINLRSADYEDMVIDARSLPRVLREHAGKQALYLSKVTI